MMDDDIRTGSATTVPQPTRAELTATAFHEAGHVVVGGHFDVPTTRVTIIPSSDGVSAGCMWHPPPLGFEADSRRDRRTRARAMILLAYAGLEAEKLVDPHAPEVHGENDRDNAFELSREHGVMPRRCDYVGDDAHQGYLEGLRRESAGLVRRFAQSIGLFAGKLLEVHEMDGHSATALALSLLERA
jgi:hypothetical protein